MDNVSRRSFVELAVGSLISLSSLAGGVIVAPATAFADDNPDVTASTGEPEPASEPVAAQSDVHGGR